MFSKIIINSILVSCLLTTASTVTAKPNNERKISPSIQKIISAKEEKNCNYAEIPACYWFKATVDIKGGELRVWKVDTKSNRYVAGKLDNGETIFVRGISKDKKYAYFSFLTEKCMSLGCIGEVDLRYLR